MSAESRITPRRPAGHSPDLSVVVPVHDEAANIEPLIAEIRAALEPLLAFEIIFVDDGSADETPAALARARRDCARLRVLRHRERCGQSAALHSGIDAARSAWIATLDGDGQNDPADIPSLLRLRDESAGPALQMVAGVRAKRRDSLGKRWASRVANAVRRRALRDRTSDTGCGLKLFRRDAFLALPYFDHMHRFLPALIRRNGGAVVEATVNHRPRASGRSHYGLLNRGMVGIIDLCGVAWLQRRASIPTLEPEEEPEDGT